MAQPRFCKWCEHEIKRDAQPEVNAYGTFCSYACFVEFKEHYEAEAKANNGDR